MEISSSSSSPQLLGSSSSTTDLSSRVEIEELQTNPPIHEPVNFVTEGEIIEEHIKKDEMNEAEIKAISLYRESLRYIHHQQGIPIEEQGLPLNAALKYVTILSAPTIEFEDHLKHEVSKICTVFLEQVLCVLKARKRQISFDGRDALYQNVSRVLGEFNQIPKSKQRTRFELKCCLGAIHRMIPLLTRIKKVVKEDGSKVLVAGVTSGVAMSPAPLVEPLLRGIADLCKEGPDIWHSDIFSIKKAWWSIVKNENLPKLPKLNKTRKAVCLAQIFDRIIKDPVCSPELKQRVFNGSDSDPSDPEDQNIVTLSQCKKYWKARLLSVKTLMELVPSLKRKNLIEADKELSEEAIKFRENQRDTAIKTLSDRLIDEKKRKVHKLVIDAYRLSSDEDKLSWKSYLTLRLGSDIEVARASIMDRIKTKINKCLGKINRTDRGRAIFRVEGEPGLSKDQRERKRALLDLHTGGSSLRKVALEKQEMAEREVSFGEINLEDFGFDEEEIAGEAVSLEKQEIAREEIELDKDEKELQRLEKEIDDLQKIGKELNEMIPEILNFSSSSVKKET